ncbi:MAG: hypothetical protein Q8P26_00345 [Candidatus Levybacteria bacterium]|nr:hypothetical protein [Candidatus Levybacteria bacterium]
MEAFRVKKKGRVFDYRVGQPLDLEKVSEYFSRRFNIQKTWQEKRHTALFVEKDGKELFLKLSTTEGIGIRSTTEKIWNGEFNKNSSNSQFLVPKNFESGYWDNLFYLIMDRFDGQFVCDLEGRNNLIDENINKIISFSEYIQSLPLDIPINDAIQNSDHQEWFKLKTKSWLDAVPKDVVRNYGLEDIWKIVVEGTKGLSKKPRHGDFTPWHIIVLQEGKLGLIDGEHAHSHGVENYDICYFIQRVHTVLGMPDLAMKLFQELLNRGYNKEKLQTVLASRAIGGFLDQSFNPNPSYNRENELKDWILDL